MLFNELFKNSKSNSNIDGSIIPPVLALSLIANTAGISTIAEIITPIK